MAADVIGVPIGEPTTPRDRLRQWLRLYGRPAFGIVVTLGCIILVVQKIDFKGVATALSNFAWQYCLLALLALTVDYAARILRWSLMLRAASAPASFRRCAPAFLGSIALNNILPARLGDVIRAFVFPEALGITRAVSTGSLVLERILDLTTLLCLLAAALLLFPGVALPPTLQWLFAFVAAGTLGMAAVILLFGRVASREADRRAETLATTSIGAKVLRAIATLLAGVSAMTDRAALAVIVPLSVLVWVGEACVFWALMKGFGIDAGFLAACLVMAIATLATLVPSSPGYVGPFHLAAFVALGALGYASDVAASFAVVAHAALWLPTTLVGGAAVLLNPGLFRRATTGARSVVS